MGVLGRRRTIETVLGIDLGTTKVKTLLVGEDGTILARAEDTYPTMVAPGGMAEQNPADWIRAIVGCTRRMSQEYSRFWPPVACCVTGQMHGLVLIGDDGSVLRPAIICSDSRADEELRDIKSAIKNDGILSITGNPGLSVFTGPKLLWVKKHEPELHSRIQTVLLPKDYVGYEMTGHAVTDPSDASGTMLYDYHKGLWDKRLCVESGIERKMMPEIRESAEIRGYVTKEFASISGIREGTPVAVGGGDLATTALGIGLEERSFGVSLGTAGIVFKRVCSVDEGKLGQHFFFRDVIPGYFLAMGSNPSAGFSVKWFREVVCTDASPDWDNLNVFSRPHEYDEDSPLMYIPFLLGTGTPYMNYAARASFIGLGPQHTHEDMYKAILEGICFSLKQSYELLGGDSIPLEGIIVCGGGSSNTGWMKIMASILGRPIEVSAEKDVAALGAAILGGLIAGWWDTLEEGCNGCCQMRNVIKPDVLLIDVYEGLYHRYLTACDWINEFFAKVPE